MAVVSFNIETPPLQKIEGEKIKSWSGRMLTFCNQTKSVRRILNPNNEDCEGISQNIGKVIRCFLRFVVGCVAGLVGGSLGTLWHAGAAIVSAAQGNGEESKKHLKSGLADLGRVLTGGLMPAFGYAFLPDQYFAKADRRSDGIVPRTDSDSPVQKEWAAVGGTLYVLANLLTWPYYCWQ